MSQVAILNPLVAQQIATGEVVDRLLYLLGVTLVDREVEQGLHEKRTKKGKARKRTKSKADGVTASFFSEDA